MTRPPAATAPGGRRDGSEVSDGAWCLRGSDVAPEDTVPAGASPRGGRSFFLPLPAGWGWVGLRGRLTTAGLSFPLTRPSKTRADLSPASGSEVGPVATSLKQSEFRSHTHLAP